MTQHLSEQDVRGIADYARIGLTDDEVVQMTVDLNSVIDSLEIITEYDLEGVPPTFHPIGGLSNVMREDVERPGFTQREALANAPKQQDGCFLIPSILGAPAASEGAAAADGAAADGEAAEGAVIDGAATDEAAAAQGDGASSTSPQCEGGACA